MVTSPFPIFALSESTTTTIESALEAMSYSNSSGGTLTLPSPNSVHHVDVTTAVRSLRRSLSRSPSKFNIVRGASHSSDCSGSSPSSPSPCRIIQRPMPPASAPQLSHQYSQSSLSTPFRSGVKLSLRSTKPKAASAKPLFRATRISPKSPIKRALSNTTDSGNSTVSSSPPASDEFSGQENHMFASFPLTLSPTSRKSSERHQSRHSMHLDISGTSKNTFPRFFESKPDPIPAISVSPLKRSDALMNPDQIQVGSPVAKRRSMHGVSAFPSDDSTIFDVHTPVPQGFEIHEDHSREYELDNGPSLFCDNLASPTPTGMPRRSDSLRRSTLQQRQGERTSWGRRQGEKHLAQMGTEVSTPAPRNRPRVSLDQFVQPALPRDSPFSAQPPLPNPSLHMLDRPSHTPQPHPLSRSLTTSSSNSSLADESPSHVPVQYERPRHSFAKSLPVGTRPPLDGGNRNAATPAYKSAKPFQDAFKSTGLISKVNRNPEQEPTYGGVKQIMPDTPCKKPIYPSNTYPTSSGGGKSRQRHSFGSPSSPFAPGRKENFVLGESDKRASLFKPFQPSHPRKGSIFNFDSDVDARDFAENIEFPPTPTKSVLFRSLGNSKSVGETPFTRSLPAPLSMAGFRDARPMPEPMSSPLGPFEKLGAASPKTPRENINLFPPDPSSLSISNHEAPKNTTFGSSFPPATPTSRQIDHFGFADRRMSITPVNGHGPSDVDMVLNSRFDQVELIGKGEFSQVFKVRESGDQTSTAAVSGTPGTPPTPSQARVFAVKKTRLPFFGAKDRESKLREVRILQTLRGRPHVLQYVDSWEKQFHLYIQTEYCEEGSLSDFLGTVGSAGRLDDFRIWKILVEACMGLQSIHDAGLIHLDIKPANILINYEGTLKIGDFGMATKWPAERGIEGEGDRRYIAPEILQGKYDMPADVFSLGLIMFEIASNVWLPDNGPHWLALREGNFSAVPTGPLTGSESDALLRDATGMPIVGDIDLTSGVSPLLQDEDLEDEEFGAGDKRQKFPYDFKTSTHDASNLFAIPKRGDLQHPPEFMVEADDPDSLDQIVQWMLAPNPGSRPTVQQVLDIDSVKWVITHRRAGATVFEGNWGPQDDGQVDTEMMDV
ncbi:Mitosis inhibitor protein kinase wee1 [Cytospora mali]|uniref:Mitosis inhibitor protein kinase wee1 n=1 Tax=Cytospora mali TaxID=578113 RepID=A0A194W8J9_CYTMA|nr:Mitosis inhibitor protein kinase wee1 [Valsa mali]